MKFKNHFDNVFTSSGNAPYAERVVLDIEKNFPDAKADNRGMTSKTGPDLVYKINGNNFFRIKKSCSIDFFLIRDKHYELIKTQTSASTHTHAIPGSDFKKLNESQYKIIFDYTTQSYHKVKNK